MRKQNTAKPVKNIQMGAQFLFLGIVLIFGSMSFLRALLYNIILVVELQRI